MYTINNVNGINFVHYFDLIQIDFIYNNDIIKTINSDNCGYFDPV